jgi:hypothetical protein
MINNPPLLALRLDLYFPLFSKLLVRGNIKSDVFLNQSKIKSQKRSNKEGNKHGPLFCRQVIQTARWANPTG